MGYQNVNDKPYLRDDSCLLCLHCEAVSIWRQGKKNQSCCAIKKTWGHWKRGKYCVKFEPKR